MNNKTKFRKLDDYLTESLKDPKEAQAFLNAALEELQEDNNIEAFSNALNILIRSQGSISEFAKNTAINRTHLYRITGNAVQPQFSTITNILNHLGFKLSVKRPRKPKSVLIPQRPRKLKPVH